MDEIGKEFISSATGSEKVYILPNTVGGTKVHLLKGVKNIRIQPVLILVLLSGVGVYLSPFKDVGGSRIIFAGPSKVFTQANKDQQRESSHAVYSLNKIYMEEFMEHNIIEEPRLDFISKMKIYPLMSFSESNGDYLVKATKLISSATFAELARVTVKAEVDCKTKNIGLSKCRFRLGSGTKIDKFQDLLKIFLLFISLYFSTLGADEFREIIKTRWRDLRSKSTDPEKTRLIPQPSRSSWGDSREFNKVNLVREMVGYKPRINNKNMRSYLSQSSSGVGVSDNQARFYKRLFTCWCSFVGLSCYRYRGTHRVEVS